MSPSTTLSISNVDETSENLEGIVICKTDRRPFTYLIHPCTEVARSPLFQLHDGVEISFLSSDSIAAVSRGESRLPRG